VVENEHKYDPRHAGGRDINPSSRQATANLSRVFQDEVIKCHSRLLSIAGAKRTGCASRFRCASSRLVKYLDFHKLQD
jgi:hypothetical protein